MSKKYQAVLQLYLNHTPYYTRPVVEKNFAKAELQTRKDTNRMFYMMERYMTSLKTHREYLEFFQIGVVRDNRRKIQNVAKYVGLAIRGFDDHLIGDSVQKTSENTQKTQKTDSKPQENKKQ